MSNDRRLHVQLLNRAAYGPSPSDLEWLGAIGTDAWIDAQLHPDAIDDTAIDDRLATLATLTMSPGDLMREYPPPQRIQRMTRDDEEPDEAMIREVARRSLVPIMEAVGARLMRAIGSRRQLHEVLVDFWFNHFNVFAGKGPLRLLVPSYERDVIRPAVTGRFRDLLGSVARSPAMLIYLDNWRSGAEPGRRLAGRSSNRAGLRGRFEMMRRERRVPERPLQQTPAGLNENYARELLELHTLGVDGGYTQDDVREVARAFTGWTVRLTRDGGAAFEFRADWHDAEEKRVLGHRLPAGRGIEDGERVLDILASHDSTARHLATKLCRRFVADDAGAGIVGRAATAFADSGGDLGATTAIILRSSELRDAAAERTKVKSPLEFLASAVRALGVRPGADRRLAGALRELGEPLYFASAPTGYPDAAEEWTSANALLARMNIGSRLAESPVVSRLEAREATVAHRIDAWLERLLPEHDHAELRRTLLDWGGSRPTEPASRDIATLILGSPEFQRR